MILTARRPSAASASRIAGASSPGSMTSASLVSGQLTIVQLQPSAPTGNVCRSNGMGWLRLLAQAERDAADGHDDRLGALGEDLVGDAGDVDQPAIGDAGGQEAEADLGRHDDDRS